jgi:2-methylisocitrate lyase-like PEP mutase family enzyme
MLKKATMSTAPSEEYIPPATRLRQLLSQPGVCIQAPGVYDGLCARLAIEQGFKVMVNHNPFYPPIRKTPPKSNHEQYQGGSMTTAARLGRADLAFASLNDFASNAQMIANIDTRIPLIADADVGFGGPPNIARMVTTYHSCGVAGFHIEDQVANKRCGHLRGKEVVDLE